MNIDLFSLIYFWTTGCKIYTWIHKLTAKDFAWTAIPKWPCKNAAALQRHGNSINPWSMPKGSKNWLESHQSPALFGCTLKSLTTVSRRRCMPTSQERARSRSIWSLPLSLSTTFSIQYECIQIAILTLKGTWFTNWIGWGPHHSHQANVPVIHLLHLIRCSPSNREAPIRGSQAKSSDSPLAVIDVWQLLLITSLKIALACETCSIWMKVSTYLPISSRLKAKSWKPGVHIFIYSYVRFQVEVTGTWPHHHAQLVIDSSICLLDGLTYRLYRPFMTLCAVMPQNAGATKAWCSDHRDPSFSVKILLSFCTFQLLRSHAATNSFHCVTSWVVRLSSYANATKMTKNNILILL